MAEKARETIKKGIDSQCIFTAKDFKAWWKNSLFIKFYEWCISTREGKATWYMKNCLTPSRKSWFHKLNIDRRSIVSISRMRSGHTALAESLYRFHIALPPNSGNTPESIDHIFWQCEYFKSQRIDLIKKVIDK